MHYLVNDCHTSGYGHIAGPCLHKGVLYCPFFIPLPVVHLHRRTEKYTDARAKHNVDKKKQKNKKTVRVCAVRVIHGSELSPGLNRALINTEIALQTTRNFPGFIFPTKNTKRHLAQELKMEASCHDLDDTADPQASAFINPHPGTRMYIPDIIESPLYCMTRQHANTTLQIERSPPPPPPTCNRLNISPTTQQVQPYTFWVQPGRQGGGGGGIVGQPT